MKEVLKEDNKKAFLLNLGIAVGIVTLLIILFFKVYLPLTTDHGDTMKVPSIVGKLEAEASKILDDNKLRYEIIDSTYASELDPLAVVRQYPSAGSDVKKNRKIYLTVNFAQSPTVAIPKGMLTNSLKNARVQLQRKGLIVGEIIEKKADYKGSVIGIIIDGRELTKSEIERGFMVKDGQVVDLVVSAGDANLGNDNESNNSSGEGIDPIEEPNNSDIP